MNNKLFIYIKQLSILAITASVLWGCKTNISTSIQYHPILREELLTSAAIELENKNSEARRELAIRFLKSRLRDSYFLQIYWHDFSGEPPNIQLKNSLIINTDNKSYKFSPVVRPEIYNVIPEPFSYTETAIYKLPHDVVMQMEEGYRTYVAVKGRDYSTVGFLKNIANYASLRYFRERAKNYQPQDNNFGKTN